MKMQLARTALLAALVLSGCAMVKLPQQPPGETLPQAVIEYGQEAEEVLSLLAYFQKAVALSAEDLRKEYTAANQAWGKDKTELGRLKLAMLYAVPGAAHRDDGRLVSLLEGSPARAAAAESPRRNLVTLLLRQAQERQRLAMAADKAREIAREEVKDERRKLEFQLAEEKRRADETQQKLDALLQIERDLRTRTPRRTPTK